MKTVPVLFDSTNMALSEGVRGMDFRHQQSMGDGAKEGTKITKLAENPPLQCSRLLTMFVSGSSDIKSRLLRISWVPTY